MKWNDTEDCSKTERERETGETDSERETEKRSNVNKQTVPDEAFRWRTLCPVSKETGFFSSNYLEGAAGFKPCVGMSLQRTMSTCCPEKSAGFCN